MTKFRFRLASVLRLREMQLTAEEEKLQMILRELAQHERLLAGLMTERAAAISFVRNQATTGNAELRALSAFLLGTAAKAASLRETVRQIQSMADEQRRRVTAAQRKERLLVKLKETKFAAWRAQTDRELEIVAQEAWTAVRNVLHRARPSPGE
ncbi:MAG TPA: hypothetical protein VK604_18520 [Bryobacteraceae bacterium]|nr:hypothetical protein [Bryobacteraceae bacterium]